MFASCANLCMALNKPPRHGITDSLIMFPLLASPITNLITLFSYISEVVTWLIFFSMWMTLFLLPLLSLFAGLLCLS
ncbi:hypothetical protein LIER_30106 [Lithospermum erythrorhizon]|uniref:Uncharacterized protein n=1 Tax=Lithospermum erythrorhizon TaxID=34254 RepID=A0AAV3RLK7_LITER